MSHPRDAILAAIVAAAGGVALYVCPGCASSPPEEPPVEPPVEEPATEEPEPVPEPEPEPEPEPDPDPVDLHGETFSFNPPGDLEPDSGTGQTAQAIYVPGMRFPIELPAAYANSQVYGHGGQHGPGGWQCSAENYAYPWTDNFCETRGYATPFCPSGTGHQGQDIRPPACPPTAADEEDDFYAVAADAGDITGINGHVLSLLGEDGTRYLYLHLDPDTLEVEAGDAVERGDRLGVVSNYFGGTPTTYHLHFEIRQSVDIGGDLTQTPVPPYLTLVDSYQRLIAGEEDSEPPSE